MARPRSPRTAPRLHSEVKSRLETVVLAYLMERPRTGRQLMDAIRREFGVVISPGRIYPLLRQLEEEGLLRASGGPKEIYYRPRERRRVHSRVRLSLEAGLRLSRFLRRVAGRRL